MTAEPRAGAAKLYTPRLLALSAALAEYPLTGEFGHTAQARSRTCGSTIALGIDCGADGGIARIGMQVTACAVGQSSAAVLAQGACGRSLQGIGAARMAIEAWLAGEGSLPEWPGFDALAAARDHKGRHEALLLPWKAACEALSTASPAR